MAIIPIMMFLIKSRLAISDETGGWASNPEPSVTTEPVYTALVISQSVPPAVTTRRFIRPKLVSVLVVTVSPFLNKRVGGFGSGLSNINGDAVKSCVNVILAMIKFLKSLYLQIYKIFRSAVGHFFFFSSTEVNLKHYCPIAGNVYRLNAVFKNFCEGNN